jgi:ABC-type glycerol-3-phosphate transport system substrate-binding protein
LRRSLLGLASIVVAAAMMVGCGSSGTSAAAKAKFCQNVATVVKTTASTQGETSTEVTAQLKADQPSIDYIKKSAPLLAVI